MAKHKFFFITLVLILLPLAFPSSLAKEYITHSASGDSPERHLSSLYTIQDTSRVLKEYNLFHNLSCQSRINSAAGEGLIVNKDFSNKSVFFEKQIHEAEPIASLTKLMTAVIALENVDPNKMITLSPRAIASFGNFGNFKKGEQFKTRDLIQGMLLSSSNDAAFALAEQLGVKKFVFLMNQKAKELNMNQTNFVDPAGLSLSNYSTTADLTKLTFYILENIPEIFSMTTHPQVEIREFRSGKMKTIHNIDKFSKDPNFLGGKTGFLLNLNKGGLLSLFRYQDYTVCVIVLQGGWANRYYDTKRIFSCLP